MFEVMMFIVVFLTAAVFVFALKYYLENFDGYNSFLYFEFDDGKTYRLNLNLVKPKVGDTFITWGGVFRIADVHEDLIDGKTHCRCENPFNDKISKETLVENRWKHSNKRWWHEFPEGYRLLNGDCVLEIINKPLGYMDW